MSLVRHTCPNTGEHTEILVGLVTMLRLDVVVSLRTLKKLPGLVRGRSAIALISSYE